MALREVILTVLARGEMTGYEITKDFEAVYVHFWRASHQQVYRELARLNKDGRVTLKVVAQGGRPDKKVYAITKRGLEELKRWIWNPPSRRVRNMICWSSCWDATSLTGKPFITN